MHNADPGHPPTELLNAFLRGKVNDADLARIGTHLSQCPDCCALLDQLPVHDALLARLLEANTPSQPVLEDPDQRRSAVRLFRNPQKDPETVSEGEAFRRKEESDRDSPSRVDFSPASLAEDLRRYQAGELIQARPVGQLERLAKWVWRHPAKAAALTLTMLLVVLSVAAMFWYQQMQIEQAAERGRLQTEQAAEKGRRQAAAQARQETFHKEMATALTEAEDGRRRLQEKLGDPLRCHELLSDIDQWQALVSAARADWQRAESVAGMGRELLSADMTTRLQRLQEQAAQTQTDFQLARKLDTILLEAAMLVDGKLDTSKAGPKYARVFLAVGMDLEGGDPDWLAALLRASGIRFALVAALDDWADLNRKPHLLPRLLEVARKADPNPWRDQFRQIQVWHDRQALEKLASQVIVAQQSPHILQVLSRRLASTGGDGVGLLKLALLSYPRDYWLYSHLGGLAKNPLVQAGYYRVTVALRPKASTAYNDLAEALRQQMDLEGAIRHYRKAIELDPNFGPIHFNLGNTLREQKDLEGALHHLQRAVELEPQYAQAHNNLGTVLRDHRKDLQGARRHFSKAIELAPNFAMCHYNLGNILRDQKDLEGAVRQFRKAIELDPNYAQAHCNLGGALMQQGEIAEALKCMQKGHELGSQKPGWPYPSATWVAQFQQMAKFDARATAILQGQAKPLNAGELLALADLCHRKKSYAAAVRFYAEAFTDAPLLADNVPKGWRYQGARAAVLAASGQGKDAKQLAEAAKTSLRQQALDWLQADFKLFAGMVPVAPAKTQEGQSFTKILLALEQLSQWQKEVDLTSIREEKELARLPPEPRQAWHQFWTEVRQLLQQAAACFRETRLSGKLTTQKRAQIHEVQLQAGKVYVLDLQSQHFDAFLRLEDAQGKKLAEDDDSGGNWNARIVFRAPEAGNYRVVATSFQQAGTGDYTLLLREFTAPDK